MRAICRIFHQRSGFHPAQHQLAVPGDFVATGEASVVRQGDSWCVSDIVESEGEDRRGRRAIAGKIGLARIDIVDTLHGREKRDPVDGVGRILHARAVCHTRQRQSAVAGDFVAGHAGVGGQPGDPRRGGRDVGDRDGIAEEIGDHDGDGGTRIPVFKRSEVVGRAVGGRGAVFVESQSQGGLVVGGQNQCEAGPRGNIDVGRVGERVVEGALPEQADPVGGDVVVGAGQLEEVFARHHQRAGQNVVGRGGDGGRDDISDGDAIAREIGDDDGGIGTRRPVFGGHQIVGVDAGR